MRYSRKHLFVSATILAIAVVFVALLTHALGVNPNVVPSALVGKPAKDFRVTFLQGQEFVEGASADQQTFSLQDFRGQPLILNFWASWCYSCRAEARDFERFWQTAKDKGIKVVGIAIQDTPEAAKAFAQEYGKTYILGLDDGDGKAAIDYGVTGVPETFVIDRNGMIIHKEAGPVSAALLTDLAEKLK